MFRSVAPWTLVIVFLAISLAAVVSLLFIVLGGGEPVWGNINVADLEPVTRSRTDRIRERLDMPVNLDKGIDANTPLKDAIEYLSDKYKLAMLIDTRAFEAIGVQKVEEQPVQLPKLVGVSMRTVLRLLMAQIKGDVHHGTHMVQEDHVVLTTTAHLYQGDGWNAENNMPPPKVDVDAVQKPLVGVLRGLADSSGVNIVVDPRVADKVRRPITATFTMVPVDSAVHLLADMGGLRVVIIDNVLYVTSPENGKELQSQIDVRTTRRREAERNSLLPSADDPGKTSPSRYRSSWPGPQP